MLALRGPAATDVDCISHLVLVAGTVVAAQVPAARVSEQDNFFDLVFGAQPIDKLIQLWFGFLDLVHAVVVRAARMIFFGEASFARASSLAHEDEGPKAAFRQCLI